MQDPRARLAPPRNLGPLINSKGEEWAPTPTAKGTSIFASAGWGGFGKHDLFEARLVAMRDPPRNLGAAINGPQKDFDAALSGKGLAFSSSFDPADSSRFFYAAKCAGGEGRMDIRETRTPIP